jgi:hypothetical protein
MRILLAAAQAGRELRARALHDYVADVHRRQVVAHGSNELQMLCAADDVGEEPASSRAAGDCRVGESAVFENVTLPGYYFAAAS